MSTVTYPHIEIDSGGVPLIAGTGFKVVEVVLDRIAYHWDADEIQRQHPTLSLSQIYSALAYYHDHQEEIDRDIDQRLDRVNEFFAKQGESDIRRRILAARHRP
jgi:uncharacterized protein (DUF433 family)